MLNKTILDSASDLAVAIDASGGVPREAIEAFLDHLLRVLGEAQSVRLRLWAFDTKCGTIREYHRGTLASARHAIAADRFGGGTLFGCNWNMMKERGIRPQHFLLFSDGLPADEWGDPDYCDTTFVLTDSGISPPHGNVVYFTEELSQGA